MPDDLPVHGLQTLTMLLRHLEPYLAICWGAQAANDAVGYWLATLDSLKLRHCPWDHAYYLFRLMLKDYKDRWEDFTAITDIPLPWNIEGPTLRKLQHCQGLGGQQENLKKIRDGWMLKPKPLPDQTVSLSSLSDTSTEKGKSKAAQEILALKALLKKYCGVSESDDEV